MATSTPKLPPKQPAKPRKKASSPSKSVFRSAHPQFALFSSRTMSTSDSPPLPTAAARLPPSPPPQPAVSRTPSPQPSPERPKKSKRKSDIKTQNLPAATASKRQKMAPRASKTAVVDSPPSPTRKSVRQAQARRRTSASVAASSRQTSSSAQSPFEEEADEEEEDADAGGGGVNYGDTNQNRPRAGSFAMTSVSRFSSQSDRDLRHHRKWQNAEVCGRQHSENFCDLSQCPIL